MLTDYMYSYICNNSENQFNILAIIITQSLFCISPFSRDYFVSNRPYEIVVDVSGPSQFKQICLQYFLPVHEK